jgi:aspartyl/asparaginyl beta-hydroxylase (cupin superfamily)
VISFNVRSVTQLLPHLIVDIHVIRGLLDQLLEKLDSLRREARNIPQWTAWPEQNHYANNSWNVFPLCYTFPANDLQKRKFIQKTCAFVPETTKLLQSLGPALRTALFSRLDPRARLGAHSGWSDLANHVLRVHIPLIVPGSKCADREARRNCDNYSEGLCGTWVDGCVETHEEGLIICFDDSKVHRAFNYSEEERIVLIIDLARPQDLPIGTATGGHSDDLDTFICGF